MKTIYLDQSDKPAIDRLRAKARRKGLRIEKSRQQIHCNNRGGLQLLVYNQVLAGVDYGLSLAQAEHWIDHYQDADSALMSLVPRQAA
ncbi:hypothetical protein [Methylobacterium indicum]|uniref:DUF4242 domain-containing protein n=1 Tax=Methylobacterium indicum TaxID=1775910 RepID=A0ABR5HJ01_9HYPH|nr:hypothetical protein [Methylobacterium indicum]KMO20363.1 hypothetical protein QR78_11000 [Methylobacterium indicum]KMO26680.1 hypothetical protein QR79_01150 [Methylobacterium indicum]